VITNWISAMLDSPSLFSSSPTNPFVIAVSVLALGLSAFVACLIPALRVSRISPMEALRAE
jgi:ABC-type antimicrobial peptide transport system permease subunit